MEEDIDFIVELQERLVKVEQDLAEAKRILNASVRPVEAPLTFYPISATLSAGGQGLAYIYSEGIRRGYGPLFAAAPEMLAYLETLIADTATNRPKAKALIRKAKGLE